MKYLGIDAFHILANWVLVNLVNIYDCIHACMSNIAGRWLLFKNAISEHGKLCGWS